MIDTGTYATLEGGMSVGPCRSFFWSRRRSGAGNYVFTGTLGCIVTDNASKDPMMLSNFHVMCVDDTWASATRWRSRAESTVAPVQPTSWVR